MTTPDLTAQITALMSEYTSRLTDLVRQVAVGAVLDALKTTAAQGAPKALKATRKSAAPKAAPRQATPARAAKGGGAGAEAKVLDYVKAHPGERSEKVRAALGMDRAPYLRAIGALIERGAIAKKGERRTTTFTAK